MKRFSILAACAAFAVGCGGGGGATDNGDDGSKTLDLGPVVTNVTGAIPAPLITSGSGMVVTGVYGGRVNDLRVKQPPMNTQTADEVANQTYLAFNQLGRPALYEFGTGNVFTVALESGASLANESYIDVSPDGTKIVAAENISGIYHIVLRNIDGSGRVQLTTGNSALYVTPRFSSDGNKIYYSKGDDTLSTAKIWSMNLDGTNKTQVSNGPVDFSPTNSPDGSKIAFYRRNTDGTEDAIWMMNADGTNKVRMTPEVADQDVGAILDWAPVGDAVAFTSHISGDDYKLKIMHTEVNQTLYPPATIYSSTQLTEAPTWSPDGNQIAFEERLSGNASEVHVIAAYGGGKKTVLSRPYPLIPTWGPYVQERKFIGAAPNVFGLSAGGFLFGQQGAKVTSLVSYDAVTRSGVTMHKQDDQHPDQPNVLVTIESSDELTSLQYVNSLTAPPTRVILPGTASTHAAGAVVSFDAVTGRVASVIPYGDLQGSSMVTSGSTQKRLTGKFLGIWDAEGKNIAPGGATEVVIDSKTGQLISHK